MHNSLLGKLKDNLLSVAPICAIVLILHFTGAARLEGFLLARFLAGAVMIVLGLAFFLIGVDIGVTPLGDRTGETLARANKIWIAVAAGLVLGFFISLAEPGLTVLAKQVDTVTEISGTGILITVSVGLALLLAVGFLRVIFNIPLYKLLIGLYILIGAAAVFTPPEFLGIAFDASGATTGILAVPFILALAVGTSSLKRDTKASEKDSFGLVAVASTGAILSVMVLSLFYRGTEFGGAAAGAETDAGGAAFLPLLPGILWDGLITLLPLLVILVILQIFSFKLHRRAFVKMLAGFVYAYIGLALFFLGVNGGFMEVGRQIGQALSDKTALALIIGFLIGFVTILAEPAVYVLTHQIEDVTSGYVKRIAVSVPLCIGVGIAVLLAVLRILIPAIQLWHYLLPGYVIAVVLSIFTPKLFVGIAFDAGGVATGPMTATFILAFTQGIADASGGANIIIEGFGMISMVALLPIITLQVLGLIYKRKVDKKEARKTLDSPQANEQELSERHEEG
ncbi:MAG: DUF1538 domain-containing protein [Oscillospiraceae bacterium]|jgi:hypothetical protein|nr:DUF1538 domain-containing protein [Oscillospiraceae bacterium]